MDLSIVDESLPHLLSIPDDFYDGVFSIHVLEHARDQYEAHGWVQEMLRVTTPGGYLLVAAPDVREYFWDMDWSHGFPTTPQRVAQILRDLEAQVVFEGTLHFGRIGIGAFWAARMASAMLPTRLFDSLARRLVGRPLMTGLKVAALWGLVFVVARKPNQ